MTRLRGWAPRGERLVDKVPQGKWKTATFLAALRNDRIDAPCLFDWPINGERFHAYVEQFLVPTLKPGDVVILDNLGSHKGKAVRKAIRDVGARLVFLPKYSPDLNPIEQVFAKFKTLLRKAEEKLRGDLRRLPQNPRPIPARRMRRIHQECRICVDPKAGRSSTSGAKPCFLSSLRINLTAAALSRRHCTSRSRTSPSSSTARQSQNCVPAIITAISSTCHVDVGRGRRRRSSRANNGPNFKTHCRTVSYETSSPLSASRSSTSR